MRADETSISKPSTYLQKIDKWLLFWSPAASQTSESILWLQSPSFLKFLACALEAGEDYSSPAKFSVAMERAALEVTMKVDKSENFLFGSFSGKSDKCGCGTRHFIPIFTNLLRIIYRHLPFQGHERSQRISLCKIKGFSMRSRCFCFFFSVGSAIRALSVVKPKICWKGRLFSTLFILQGAEVEKI